MMELKVKRLKENAKLPEYASNGPGNAGLDLTATDSLHTDNYVEYGTGLSVEIPQGFVGLIFPRSSISNKDLTLTNSVGVIDSNYRGEIRFRFKPAIAWNGNNKFGVRSGFIYNVGEKVGQMIIMPIPKIEVVEVEELTETDRGIYGFGSTGK